MSEGYIGNGKVFTNLVVDGIRLNSRNVDGFAPVRNQSIIIATAGVTTAILLTTYSTLIEFSPIASAGSSTHALAAGLYLGQIKEIIFDGGGSTGETATVTPSTLEGAETTVVFTADTANHNGRVLLSWDGRQWVPVSIQNVVLA